MCLLTSLYGILYVCNIVIHNFYGDLYSLVVLPGVYVYLM